MRKFDRLNVEFAKCLDRIINFKLKDPRLDAHVTVNDVKTSRDLRYATAYVVVSDKSREDEILKTLNGAQGCIREFLDGEVRARYIPHFTFVADRKYEEMLEIDGILKKLRDERRDS